jgi:predicted acyl esterase
MNEHLFHGLREARRSGGHLAFASEPLAGETTVAGHPVLSLAFACDQADACIFAYLEDIAPDGRRRYVAEGMLRALHREARGGRHLSRDVAVAELPALGRAAAGARRAGPG